MKWFLVIVVLLIILGLGYYGYRKMSHKMMQSVPTTQPTTAPSARPSQAPSAAPTTSGGSMRY